MTRVFVAAGLAWLLAGGAVLAQDSGTSGEKTGIKVLDLGPPGSTGSSGAAGGGGTVKLPQSPGSARPGAALPKNRAIGPLDASQGGLGRTLWAGSSFNRVEDMMARLPADSASPAMRALMRRLLLTLADPPADTPAARSLLPVRAERLYAMGDAGAVDALLGRAEDLLDQLMARMRIDAWLLANEIDPACVLVGDTLAAHPSHYLQKVSVFCQAHRGMGDQSRITLELVREEATLQAGPEKAAFKEFEDLFLRIGQEKTRPVRQLKSVTPLHLAMLNAANAGVPPRAAKGLDFPKRLAVARNPHTRVEIRLAGAEDGVAAGALEPVHLERTYLAMRLPNISAERVRSTPARTFGPRQRAMFFQAARKVANPQDRARILAREFELARETGTVLLVLQASESLVRAIPPAPDLSWFAGDAVRALYAAGTPSDARIWVKMLQSSARPGTPEDRVLNGVWALAQIGDSFAPPPADPRRFQDWITNTRSTGGGDAPSRITLMIALLEALGLPSPGVDVQAVLGSAKAAAQAQAGVQWWQTVEQASRAGRRGETVLAALLALGEAGPGGSQSRSLGRIDPYIAGVIVAGLKRVGLDADARAIALDIALSAGL